LLPLGMTRRSPPATSTSDQPPAAFPAALATLGRLFVSDTYVCTGPYVI
jgi:hypothetical protein